MLIASVQQPLFSSYIKLHSLVSTSQKLWPIFMETYHNPPFANDSIVQEEQPQFSFYLTGRKRHGNSKDDRY